MNAILYLDGAKLSGCAWYIDVSNDSRRKSELWLMDRWGKWTWGYARVWVKYFIGRDGKDEIRCYTKRFPIRSSHNK